MAEKEINWEKIELDYRVGVKSQFARLLRKMKLQNQLDAVQSRWVRDLSEKIKPKPMTLCWGECAQCCAHENNYFRKRHY